MKTIIILLLLSTTVFGQNPLDERLYEAYDQFKEELITQRRFKHKNIKGLVNILKKYKAFTVRKIGESLEGRSINLISIGKGDTHVLLWSQMHGDEPTATMAIMDIFNFYKQENEFAELKELLHEKLTIHFIPMLNPDGAERYMRRNAAGIDLNRDALRLQFPESQALKQVRDSLNADWGFNLHDQSRYYSAGQNPNTASISFLAPAYNYQKEVNEGRKNAMKLIGHMTETLQKYIPGNIAKYSDEFEPRAFGDNIQKWGTNTILIESGGLYEDREKQELRKLHFITILTAMESIASASFAKTSTKIYKDLPFNKGRFHDLIIRNINYAKDGIERKFDIAMRWDEIDYNNYYSFYLSSFISDLGDLHTYFGYKEIDAEGYNYIPGTVYEKSINSLTELKSLDILSLLQSGVTDFSINTIPEPWKTSSLPVKIIYTEKFSNNDLRIGGNPSFLLEKNKEFHYAVINGRLIDLRNGPDAINEQLDPIE